MKNVKAIYIRTDTKRILDELCVLCPDIKKIYFCDNAIREHLLFEIKRRNLIDNAFDKIGELSDEK